MVPSDTDPPPESAPADTGTAEATSVPPVVVPKWVQLVLLPLALLGLWALARAAGPVLLILIAASTLALILNPLIQMVERRSVRRGLAILIVYLGLFAVLVGIGVLLSDPVSSQVTHFADAVPRFIRRANRDLADLQHFLNHHGIHVQIQQQGHTALQTLEKNVLKGSGNLVSFSRDILSKVVTVGFALVLALVLSVYLLLYGPQIGELTRRVMPPGDGTPEDDYPRLVQRAVFGYVRGQLLFSLIMGTSAGICLWVFGVLGIFPAGAHYAVFFGAFYGLMELIPYVGPILGAAPPVLVALFNDPISAVWVILLFVALQQLEGHFVAPQVFRISLRINPILIILSLLIGYQIYGIAGALLALPVAAVIRETTIYLRRHLVLEPWRTVGPEAGLEAPASPPEGDVTIGAARGPARPESEAEPEPDTELDPHSRLGPPTRLRAVPTTASAGNPLATLAVRSLTKRFGDRTALHDVSFELGAGEIVGIIGPNGAGKTTLLSILAGILTPSDGEVTHAPRQVGWVPQQPAVYAKLSVAQNLRLFARLEKLAEPESAVLEMLDQTGLEARADDEVGELSAGNQQRVNIAVGILCRPPVLLLDEPSAALDPRQRERLWEFIGGLARRGTTVVFSTHNVAEVELYATRVLVLVDGELLFSGTPPELEQAVGEHSHDLEAASVRFLHERGH